jgi:hypothetical protein
MQSSPETSSRYSTALLGSPTLSTAFHDQFVRRAGALYGLIFALGFAAIFWGLDAIALLQASAYLAWGKLLLGLIVCMPLAMLIGWLAAAMRWSALSIIIWIIGLALIALVAGHIPYDGLSWLAALNDPYPSGYPMYPFSLPAAGFTGISMVIGLVTGLLVGLVSLIVTERAWESSTSTHRFSFRSVVVLGLCLPFTVIYGLLADYQINASIRDALVDTAAGINLAADPSTDLVQAKLNYFRSVRPQMTGPYTLYWVKSSDDLVSTTVDAQYASGLLLRCQHANGQLLLCVDFGKNLHDWMSQLATVGHLTCVGCYVQVDRDTRSWLAAVLPTLGNPLGSTDLKYRTANLRDVSLRLDLGGWIYMRATYDNGRAIDCRFSGDRPVVVDLCVEAK